MTTKRTRPASEAEWNFPKLFGRQNFSYSSNSDKMAWGYNKWGIIKNVFLLLFFHLFPQYNVDNYRAHFYVDDVATATAIHKCSHKITDTDGYKVGLKGLVQAGLPRVFNKQDRSQLRLDPALTGLFDGFGCFFADPSMTCSIHPMLVQFCASKCTPVTLMCVSLSPGHVFPPLRWRSI